MTERRRHPRIPVEAIIEARLVAGETEAVGRVLDLNNAGAFIATDLVVEKNGKLEIELRLPGVENAPPLQAVVARRIEPVEGRHRTIPGGLGVVFLTSSLMERSFVQQAVLLALKSSLETTRKRVFGPERPRRL